ncbi:hypothetical protein [Bacillus wiedmannii]|uniref:hypothetical protein n=1 Tax=Bacillus wiedmannii TaxID=1890302 RepID=UPI002FFE0CAF
MEIYIFPSYNITNAWAAVGGKKWAVKPSENESTNKGYKTKSQKMLIGSFGMLYNSEQKEFTIPFVVKSKARDIIENEIWNGEFILPFEIIPLGDPSKRITKEELERILTDHNDIKGLSIFGKLSPSLSFNSNTIKKEVWNDVLERLVF